MAQQQGSPSSSHPPAMPRPAIRAALSVLILLQLGAVFVGPWAMQPASDLAAGASWIARPYLQATFLDNGYRFFAPEPGPSHLVRYELVLKDGSRRSGLFPNRQDEWPRLLYHRYFMLSEFLSTTQFLAEARRSQEMVDACARSYARHLAHQYDAKQVKLFLRERAIPTIFQVRDGMKLNDPALFEVNKELEFGPYQEDEL